MRRNLAVLGHNRTLQDAGRCDRQLVGWIAVERLRQLGGFHDDPRMDHRALQRLWSQRLGRTVLLTNRLDWTAEQVVAGYSGQPQIERVFRGLKDGDWLGWGPMHHWTDSKIRIHVFYCMLGI